MKGKILLFFIGVVIMIGALTGCLKQKKDIKDIEILHFSYSVGYMMNAYCKYTLDLKDDVYTATIKPNGIPDEEKRTYEVDKDKVVELANRLNETKIYLWDGFKKSDRNVMDGDSFSFYLRFGDKEKIDASGYMMWPTDYAQIKGVIEGWFAEIDLGKEKTDN